MTGTATEKSFEVISVSMEVVTGSYVKTESVEPYIQRGSITTEFLAEATSELTLKGNISIFQGCHSRIKTPDPFVCQHISFYCNLLSSLAERTLLPHSNSKRISL